MRPLTRYWERMFRNAQRKSYQQGYEQALKDLTARIETLREEADRRG